MYEWSTFLVFIAAAFSISIMPGPSNFYVLARSLGQGSRAGVVSALGLATGSLLHVAAAALGISAVLAVSAWLFGAVKYAGACYLVYLGFKALRYSGGAHGDVRAAAPKRLRRIFLEGVVVEVTNPKTVLFFLAFIPQFVDPAAGPVWLQTLVLGAVLTATALPCDLLVTFLGGRVVQATQKRPWLQRLQHRIMGTIFIGLGLRLALSEMD